MFAIRYIMKLTALAVAVVCVASIAGCDGKPKVVAVSGTLTQNGKPVPFMTIHFVPADGRASWGVTDENGRFSLKQDSKTPGVAVGSHTVWVEWRPLTPTDEMDPKNARKPSNVEALQEKFGSAKASPLKIEIAKSIEDIEVKLD